MKVILDENLPHGLKRILIDLNVTTVQEYGLSGVSNGELITRIDGIFDALLTADKNLRYQQNLSTRQIAIVELPSNQWPAIKQPVAAITTTLRAPQPGEYRLLSAINDS